MKKMLGLSNAVKRDIVINFSLGILKPILIFIF